MSGWLLLAAILVAAALGWLILANWRAARARRSEPPGPRRPGPPVSRCFGAGRPVTDTEFSAETFLPPEAAEPEPGPGLSAPAEAPVPGEGRGRSPWGTVAVPGWEHPLPWSYGVTRLTALVRDPYWLFAYWEITGEALERAARSVGRAAWLGARSVLRVYDLTGGGHYDVAVDEEARNWYLNVGQPDRTWYLELGRLTPEGRFVMLARSNTVHTPRDGPSSVIDRRWPPLGREISWPEGMPASPGMPPSPGSPASGWNPGPARGRTGGGSR